ncbi:MAG: methyltransferase domain-containing protein [Candidatus Paceibacterota bacterium]
MSKFTFATREEGFDNHIDKSIRGYSDLWNDILKLSEYFVEDDTDIVDIGCSTGKLLKKMKENNYSFAPKASYIGVEIEESFYSEFDKDEEECHYTKPIYVRGDILNYSMYNCSLVTSIFTLQFMSQKDRQNVIDRIYQGLNKGGAFIFAEKTLAESARMQDILTFTYYDYKKNFFGEKDILDKESELRHMLKPVTEAQIYESLYEAGFHEDYVESFWKSHLFQGFIAIKS